VRCQTDLTEAEWRVIEPCLPPPKTTGRPRAWPMREIANAIFYVPRGGSAWRLSPSDVPPWGTAYRWFAAWRDTGLFERLFTDTAYDHERGIAATRVLVEIVRKLPGQSGFAVHRRR
jgi:transposase